MSDLQSIAASVAHDFGLGPLREVARIGRGHSEAYKLKTASGRYFVKEAGEERKLWLYDSVQRHLNRAGVRQPELLYALNGKLTAGGFAVYEYLEGEQPDSVGGNRLDSLVKYIAAFHQALRDFPIPDWLETSTHPWDRANSIDYLFTQFLADIAPLKISRTVQKTVESVLEFLQQHQDLLKSARCQLIHGDIGADNVVFSGDEVVAAIDFTPALGPDLYALCLFFYWQFLVGKRENAPVDDLRKAVDIYSDALPGGADTRFFHPLLTKAAAFRLFGPLLCCLDSSRTFSSDVLERRAAIARSVMEDQELVSYPPLKGQACHSRFRCQDNGGC